MRLKWILSLKASAALQCHLVGSTAGYARRDKGRPCLAQGTPEAANTVGQGSRRHHT